MTITAETGQTYVPFLRQRLRAAHATLQSMSKWRRRRFSLRELSLVLVGDARMGELHHRFMGLPGPTDVLTFPIDQTAAGAVTSGEVIACVPEARRQAKRRNIEVRVELLLYSIHGMLHLLGYDDRTARDFHTMHRIEDQLMTHLGFGPVFSGLATTGGRGSRRVDSSARKTSARQEPRPPRSRQSSGRRRR